MGKPANVSDNGITQLAGRYARIMSALYSRRELRGKLAKATRGARHLALGVRLADPLALDAALSLAEPLALACRCPAVIAARSEADPGLVAYQFQLPARWWQSYTRADLDGAGLGVGFAEGRRQVNYTWSPPHAGVFGTTDSGKSETIRSVLVGLFAAYDPAELGALLIDPHRDHESLANVAHLAAPVAHDQQTAAEVLAWTAGELARRRAANERDGRRLVVAIDEAPAVLADDRAVAIVVELAREARKFKINLLVGSQETKEAALPGGLATLLNNRWIGLVSDAHVSARLTGRAGIAAHLLTGYGDFVHLAGATVERLQVALATDADLDRLPRVVEVPALDVPPVEEPELLSEPEPRRGGRPPLEVEARHVASYLFYDPHSISIAMAREEFGLTRGQHDLHKTFTLEVQRCLDYLQESEVTNE